ncbi:nucleotidyltransferase domain-containing protein [Paenibacillus terreus]|uniref:Nucleotidyltransferase domain-containing protein n=1 Tax=Paenibacillus terreus TaxID=1387834 RepID=A0ABV5BD97_9BACL
MVEHIIKRAATKLQECPFVKGIALGGSRATGTATETSDIDIGIYYERSIDFDQLNNIAKQLDDTHRENLICREGEWGNWVNGGGWLIIDGYHVDFILRDMERVKECVAQTDRGVISSHYQPGHPHAYINVMYRGELASSKILYARDHDITKLKSQAEIYPDSLKEALISFFLFEAEFSCSLAKNYSMDNDLYYIIGHLFRSISALNQVLFAANDTYCLNEKKATLRIGSFTIAPIDYRNRVNKIFSLASEDIMMSIYKLEQLCNEVEKMINSKHKKGVNLLWKKRST